MAKKMVTVRLSPANARLVALNIDGWLDAGACKGGLEPDEHAALHSAYDQILRGLGGKLTRASIEEAPSISSSNRAGE
jgi:hypothetical protein